MSGKTGKTSRTNRAPSHFLLPCVLGLGFAFLYLPILLLVLYSFNEGRLVTVWSGFSTKWYVELFQNDQILGAAWLSLKIGAINATFATVLGTLAALAMVRFGPFFGRTLLGGMLSAPLVMPEIITGLSALLLFVALEDMIGIPEGRGVSTITIAHITFSLAYVSVVVRARLKDLDPSIEEAARDLGARPLSVFLFVTLPMIAPALVAGWLLAFTLSLDDLVIASFVSGPGSSTLPMVVFSSVRLGVSPEINALATLLVAFAATGILIAGLLTLRWGRSDSQR
ncbi:MAG: ABC transporter permease subunit [Rhodospirillaceae bacterium]